MKKSLVFIGTVSIAITVTSGCSSTPHMETVRVLDPGIKATLSDKEYSKIKVLIVLSV